MLNIAADLSDKWRLKFNNYKFYVLVCGKRINVHEIWKLGDSYISEVNSYKYLGVHISRNLSDHYHLTEVLKNCSIHRIH